MTNDVRPTYFVGNRCNCELHSEKIFW